MLFQPQKKERKKVTNLNIFCSFFSFFFFFYCAYFVVNLSMETKYDVIEVW